MALSLRSYLFEEDGTIKRVPRRVVEGLIFGNDAMLQYANTVQRVAAVIVENEDGKPLRVVSAEGSFWTFDEDGKIDEGLRQAAAVAMDLLPLKPSSGKIVSLSPSLKRRQFRQQHRWDLSKEHLDLIAADVWPSEYDRDAKISVATGKEPRKPPLTYEAKEALREIEPAIAVMKSKLERLSEPALKGLAFQARDKAEFENDLWAGLAVDCDHVREIKVRRRTGRGSWYAVVEAERTLPGQDFTEVDVLALEKCEGRKAAVIAARRLLKENADTLSEYTSIRTALYCELEWSPAD